MESLCSEIYGASSIAIRCKLAWRASGCGGISTTEPWWIWQALTELFLQNWLVQGTFLGSDESTDLYIGYYGSIMHEHMSTVLFSVASRDSGELLKQVPI
jgi:hypothetical protein